MSNKWELSINHAAENLGKTKNHFGVIRRRVTLSKNGFKREAQIKFIPTNEWMNLTLFTYGMSDEEKQLYKLMEEQLLSVSIS